MNFMSNTSPHARFATDDRRWAAVERRDASADGAFYYGVRTTGVYCRPSCAGRALRRNVSFHATREDARRAGLRPCKRCRPDEDRPVVRYAVGQCSLGAILVAASADGICAVLPGEDRETLLADLRRRFARTSLVEEAALAPWLRQVIAAVDEPAGTIDLPLVPRGTPFQQQVWRALRGIAPGSTATYADIAARIGLPKASRAVAQACGANPIAVLVPCHRVVRGDGTLSGYRWGVERKRALLAREVQA